MDIFVQIFSINILVTMAMQTMVYSNDGYVAMETMIFTGQVTFLTFFPHHTLL